MHFRGHSRNNLLLELTPQLRHELKRLAKRTTAHTRAFIREIDRAIPTEANNFGMDADSLREKIDEWINEC